MLMSSSGCALPHVSLQHQTRTEEKQALLAASSLAAGGHRETSNEVSSPKSKLTQGLIYLSLLLLIIH